MLCCTNPLYCSERYMYVFRVWHNIMRSTYREEQTHVMWVRGQTNDDDTSQHRSRILKGGVWVSSQCPPFSRTPPPFQKTSITHDRFFLLESRIESKTVYTRQRRATKETEMSTLSAFIVGLIGKASCLSSTSPDRQHSKYNNSNNTYASFCSIFIGKKAGVSVCISSSIDMDAIVYVHGT